MKTPRPRSLCVLGAAGLLALPLGCGGDGVEPAPAARASTGTGADEEVAPALHWLETHQSGDGSWEAAGFDRWRMGVRGASGDVDGRGRPHNDVAVTALAILRHLDLGYGPRDPGPLGPVVAWGLHALRERQGTDGCVSDRSRPLWATNHAIAAWALADATGMDAGAETEDAARRALAFLSRSLAERLAAWSGERGPADLPPIAWATLAFAAARETDRKAGATSPRGPALLRDEAALESARAEVAGWVAPEGGDRTVGRLGAGLLARALADPRWAEASDAQAAVAWLSAHLPAWDPAGAGVDFAGWYLGTVALLAAAREPWTGREAWKRWDGSIKAAFIDTQRMDGDACLARGSWDPVGVWAAEGGRVFTTAMGGLVLGVYYRYDKVVGTSPPPSDRPTITPPAPPPSDALPERVYGRCK